MVRLDAEQTQSEDDVKGFSRPLAGRYHVVVKDVDESHEKFENSIPVEIEVLKGTTPGQEGKLHTEFFSISEKAIDRLLRFSLTTGIVRPGEKKDVSISDAVGRQLIVELEDHSYEKNGEVKKGVRISFLGMWSVGNDEVKDVPKDKEALKLGTESKPVAAASDQLKRNGSGAQNTSDDEWSDI